MQTVKTVETCFIINLLLAHDSVRILLMISLIRVASVMEKYLVHEIFSRSGKSQGNLLMARDI